MPATSTLSLWKPASKIASPGRRLRCKRDAPRVASNDARFRPECPPEQRPLFPLDESLPRNFHNYYAVSPIVNVAAYPLDGLPATVAISELRLSAKMPSRVFVVGFEPRDA